MKLFQIELTDEERILAEELSFQPLIHQDHIAVRENGERAATLFHRLKARDAIPTHRLSYMTAPDYNAAGRGYSRVQLFERNGPYGEEILKHPHFLKYLYYFIYGARLPEGVIEQFSEAVDACGNVTSGDIIPLGKKARDLARSNSLQFNSAGDEFYKLALDCGLSPDVATSICEKGRTTR